MIFLFTYFFHKPDLEQRLQIFRYSLMKCVNFFLAFFSLLWHWNKQYNYVLLNQPKEDFLVAGQKLVTRAHMYFLVHSLSPKFKTEEVEQKL